MISHRAVLEEGPKSGGNKMQGLLKEKVLLLNQNTFKCKIAWNAPVQSGKGQLKLTHNGNIKFFYF